MESLPLESSEPAVPFEGMNKSAEDTITIGGKSVLLTFSEGFVTIHRLSEEREFGRLAFE